MKIFFLTSIILIFSISLSAKSFNEIDFVNNTGDKKVTTINDGVTFFILLTNNKMKSFKMNQQKLIKLKLLDRVLQKNDILTRGQLSLMVVRFLKLDDSLLYNITEAKRYAFRLCVSEGIMKFNGSEYDKISGSELIEVVSKILEKREIGN